MTVTTIRPTLLLLLCGFTWSLILLADLWVGFDPLIGGAASGADTEHLGFFTPSSASNGWTPGVAMCLVAALALALGLWLLANATPSAVFTLEIAGCLSVLGQAVEGHAEAFVTMMLLAVGAGLLLTARVRVWLSLPEGK